MSKELVWDGEKWVEKGEHEEMERVKKALRKLLEEMEFDIEIDLKSGKGSMKLKKS